jgi:DNA polymerase III subunit gamma/tau
MSESTSLYRRHRPGSFDEVVGQQHVVRTLRNAVERDKVHHAYLFVGSRGTGKTSMAKILARSLNCAEGGPTTTPCGKCESCLTIASGSSVDVIEMDAASNRSVDDIRDLRERVAYAPTGGRWKVYILDEAHMLTKEAWNAFLKTLEEPPPNTVFVLATTESHKVMATIADRCQRFDFQRPSLEQISEVLRRVSATEEIEIDDGAVAMISRSASGSFRDALGTLDQLSAFGDKKIDLESVLELIGAVDSELLFGSVDAVAAEDPKQVLLEVEKIARSGRDPVQFARDLLAHLRHLLVVQTVGEVPESFVVSPSDAGRLTAQATAVKAGTLIRAIDEVAAAMAAIREGDDARMAVEIALLKAARPDLDASPAALARRVERLERQLAGAAPPPPARQPSKPAAPKAPPQAAPVSKAPAEVKTPAEVKAPAEAPPAQEKAAKPAKPEAPKEKAPAPQAAKPAPVEIKTPAEPAPVEAPAEVKAPPEASPEALDLDQIVRIWPAMLDHLRQSAPALVAVFEGARPVELEGGTLKVGFPANAPFNKRKAEAPDKRDQVAAALQAVTGTPLRPVYVLRDGEAEPASAAAEEKLDEQELLERLKSEFDAEEVG